MTNQTPTEQSMADLDMDLDTFMTATPEPEAKEPAPAVEGPELPLEPETEEPEQEPETDEQDEEPKPKKEGRSTADRIRKLTADRRQAEREVQELKDRLAKLEAAKEAPLTPETPADKKASVEEPDPANYRYGELDPQFTKDMAAFTAKVQVEGALAALRAEQAAERETAQQRSAADQKVEELRKKATEVETLGASKFSDFDEVVTQRALAGEWELTQEMFELAVETAAAPEILYHLAQNPDEAETVAKLAPRQQALWFGRMEAKFSTPAAPPARKVSQAPAPVNSVRGSGGRSVVPDDTDDLEAFERKFFKVKG